MFSIVALTTNSFIRCVLFCDVSSLENSNRLRLNLSFYFLCNADRDHWIELGKIQVMRFILNSVEMTVLNSQKIS